MLGDGNIEGCKIWKDILIIIEWLGDDKVTL